MSNSANGEPESLKVERRLRAEILDGVREPGSKLVEREIAEDLGVSRIPVRDALKTLEAEGLVTLRPRTWAVVRELTPSDIADFTEVRSSIEVLAFRLAAGRWSRDELERLRSTLETETEAAARGDGVTARRAAADFHDLVVDMAGNQLLAEIWSNLGSRMRWLLGQHDDLGTMAADHAVLFEAIAARDIDGVERLSLVHLTTSRESHDRYREQRAVDRIE